MADAIDQGSLPLWTDMACPKDAISYYNLEKGAKMKDLILNLRADAASHRELNHQLADFPNYQDTSQTKVTILNQEKIA
jgi:hypothetical protein